MLAQCAVQILLDLKDFKSDKLHDFFILPLLTQNKSCILILLLVKCSAFKISAQIPPSPYFVVVCFYSYFRLGSVCAEGLGKV